MESFLPTQKSTNLNKNRVVLQITTNNSGFMNKKNKLSTKRAKIHLNTCREGISC
jgi:hypothetical protein